MCSEDLLPESLNRQVITSFPGLKWAAYLPDVKGKWTWFFPFGRYFETQPPSSDMKTLAVAPEVGGTWNIHSG